MVEGFEQDDFDMLDQPSKQVLFALAEVDESLLAKVDYLHRRTSLMPTGMNDAIRHLTKAGLIEVLETPKKIPPYNFYAVELTELGRQVVAEFG